MDDVATDPYTLVRALYAFAAIFALTAGYFWSRFVAVQTQREHDGGPLTSQWLKEAGGTTALTLFCAGGAFLISLTL